MRWFNSGRGHPKSKAGRRHLPITQALRTHLVEAKLRRGGSGLIFGQNAGVPFVASTVWRRTHSVWEDAGLEAIGFHEASHTYASLLIASGVSIKELAGYLGHASVMLTIDRYGHLLPGNEMESARRLDAYLAANG